MKKIAVGLYFIALVALAACGGNQAKKTEGVVTDTTADERLYIKDKLQYTEEFIENVRGQQLPEKIWLIDSAMIVGKDTAIFPTILKPGKLYTFKGKQGRNMYVLTAIRINYSSVDYDFSLTENGMTKYLNKGQATISPRFYIAAENDSDEEEGDNYGAVEYIKEESGCFFTIRIGLDKDGKGRLRAKISSACQDKSKNDVALNDCPVMRTP